MWLRIVILTWFYRMQNLVRIPWECHILATSSLSELDPNFRCVLLRNSHFESILKCSQWILLGRMTRCKFYQVEFDDQILYWCYKVESRWTWTKFICVLRGHHMRLVLYHHLPILVRNSIFSDFLQAQRPASRCTLYPLTWHYTVKHSHDHCQCSQC